MHQFSVPKHRTQFTERFPETFLKNHNKKNPQTHCNSRPTERCINSPQQHITKNTQHYRHLGNRCPFPLTVFLVFLLFPHCILCLYLFIYPSFFLKSAGHVILSGMDGNDYTKHKLQRTGLFPLRGIQHSVTLSHRQPHTFHTYP